MDRINMKYLLLLAGFLITIQQSTAKKRIKCYVCNSYFAQDCSDWFNNRTFSLEQCAVGVTMCRKIVTELYYEGQWDVRYIRECAESGEVGGDEGRRCMERTGTKKVKARYCHCNNQDGCNEAASVKLPLMLLTLPVLTVLAMVFRKL